MVVQSTEWAVESAEGPVQVKVRQVHEVQQREEGVEEELGGAAGAALARRHDEGVGRGDGWCRQARHDL